MLWMDSGLLDVVLVVVVAGWDNPLCSDLWLEDNSCMVGNFMDGSIDFENAHIHHKSKLTHDRTIPEGWSSRVRWGRYKSGWGGANSKGGVNDGVENMG